MAPINLVQEKSQPVIREEGANRMRVGPEGVAEGVYGNEGKEWRREEVGR